MKIRKIQCLAILSILVIVTSFSGCLTSKKMDVYVGSQYNNTLPKQDKKKNPDITVTSPLTFGSDKISESNHKTSHMLPLIIYWQWDYRHTCTLNPAIGVANFANTIHAQANKGLNQKLNGQKLELSILQVPSAFALVDKAHVIWVIYAYSWDHLFVEPDFKDLIVSYKVTQNGAEVKSGKIAIKNNEKSNDLRFFQSWRSATSEYLTQYNMDITNMTKTFINDLIQEL